MINRQAVYADNHSMIDDVAGGRSSRHIDDPASTFGSMEACVNGVFHDDSIIDGGNGLTKWLECISKTSLPWLGLNAP
jgi:hypothetical protein